MESKDKQNMKVIPVGERKCIWMDAGIVSYKLCTAQYQCNVCEFDMAMSNRVKKSKMETQENVLVASEKKAIVEWMDEFRHLPADERKCRYMLMGNVPYKICPNSFRCGECSFDQMMQDREQPSFILDLESFDKVAGFYVHESLYYFRNHTWLQLERNGKYQVGIDDFARRLVGRVTSIELPAVGRDLELEEHAWTIHHEYGDLKFISPVNGIVETTNQKLIDNPELLTEDPFVNGWVMKVEPKSIARTNKNLLQGSEAKKWVMDESNLLHKSVHGDESPTLHDGAVVADDISKNISKEKWLEITKKHLLIL